MSLSLIKAAGVEFITSLIIQAGTSGDEAKQSARATDALAVITALQRINGGDVAGGTEALLTAFNTASALSKGELLALTDLLNGSQDLLENLMGTVSGQVAIAIADKLLASAAKAASAFLPTTPAAAVPATA